MNVLAFGEILWDIIEGKKHLGGAPFNFASHAAQCGNQSYIISRLGKDALGEEAFKISKEHHVDGTFIQWDSQHPTGTVNVTLKDGQPDYIIEENVAYDFITYDQTLKAIQNDYYDVFYFGSLAQRNLVSAATLTRILTNHHFHDVFYDVNLRKKGYSDVIIKRSLPYCSILKLNIDEVPEVSRIIWNIEKDVATFCDALRREFSNIETIIITAADKGCMVYQNSRLITVPGVPVKVADAVGAGDAFSAAFMHNYMRYQDASRAAKVANSMGAFVASQHGAIPAYSDAIKKLLAD